MAVERDQNFGVVTTALPANNCSSTVFGVLYYCTCLRWTFRRCGRRRQRHPGFWRRKRLTSQLDSGLFPRRAITLRNRVVDWHGIPKKPALPAFRRCGTAGDGHSRLRWTTELRLLTCCRRCTAKASRPGRRARSHGAGHSRRRPSGYLGRRIPRWRSRRCTAWRTR